MSVRFPVKSTRVLSACTVHKEYAVSVRQQIIPLLRRNCRKNNPGGGGEPPSPGHALLATVNRAAISCT